MCLLINFGQPHSSVSYMDSNPGNVPWVDAKSKGVVIRVINVSYTSSRETIIHSASASAESHPLVADTHLRAILYRCSERKYVHDCNQVQKFYFYYKGVVKRLKYLSGTVISSSNARH